MHEVNGVRRKYILSSIKNEEIHGGLSKIEAIVEKKAHVKKPSLRYEQKKGKIDRRTEAVAAPIYVRPCH